MTKRIKKKNLFSGKPFFQKGSSGFICFSGKKLDTSDSASFVSGYYFRFWGSKTWRFISLKTVSFLSHNYVDNQDYGNIK